jgi:hypothetical protein
MIKAASASGQHKMSKVHQSRKFIMGLAPADIAAAGCVRWMNQILLSWVIKHLHLAA